MSEKGFNLTCKCTVCPVLKRGSPPSYELRCWTRIYFCPREIEWSLFMYKTNGKWVSSGFIALNNSDMNVMENSAHVLHIFVSLPPTLLCNCISLLPPSFSWSCGERERATWEWNDHQMSGCGSSFDAHMLAGLHWRHELLLIARSGVD